MIKRNKSGSTGGGDFLKLVDGASEIGVCRGDFVTYTKKWVDGDSIKCDPADPAAKFYFKVNFVQAVNGAYVVKVLDRTGPLYDQLYDIEQAGFDLNETPVKISRVGSTIKDTKYKAELIFKDKKPVILNAQQLEKISHVQLKNLKEDQNEPTSTQTADQFPEQWGDDNAESEPVGF